MFVDTHCHISYEDYDNIDELIMNIKNSKVEKIIVNGTDMKSNLFVLELVRKYDIVYGALGFHPTELDDFSYDYLDWLDKNIDNDKIVALGEIGLDYHYENTNKERQIDVLRKQLDIAVKHNKPIIFHCRDAIGDTYNILKKYNLKGTMHAYSGSLDMALKFIKLGYCLGVGGVVTFKNAKNIIEVIKNIDLKYIVLETDAPFLTPEPYRGKKNDSSFIYLVAEKIALIKGISCSDVAHITNDVASELFDL